MNKIITVFSLCLVAMPAFALTPAGTSRRSMTSQMVMSAPRATASTKQISATAAVNNAAPVEKSSVRVEEVEASVPAKDMREKEKAACINNNIGIGNTFVWASRYSNTNNYASMVEDVENPENNICFVKVELKSSDSKISVADVPSQYFEMGRDITCGAWADEGVLRQRILDAKKTARTWGTVGGAVGGAGVGVGMMELFGNKLIGGKVEGQKDKNLSEAEVMRSVLLVMKKEERSRFDQIMDSFRALEKECTKDIWNSNEKPSECDEIDYEYFLSLDS